MLLRRITQHVKEQNWFAVFVDFLIVVIGVFIGLQVQEWALERERKTDEKAYLNRLHSETIQLTKLRAHYDETRPLIIKHAFNAYQKLKNHQTSDKLEDQECNSLVWTSPAFRTIPPSELPTISELLASGRLETISSEPLRITILEYTQEVNKARDYIDASQADKSNITKQFPSLFELSIVKSPDFIKIQATSLGAICAFKEMRNDKSFLNSATRNIKFYESYYRRGIIPVTAKLKELHKALDKELSINHLDPKGTE